MLPVSALGSWVYCPRQCFLSYAVGIFEPPNAAMLVGSVKHKIHEVMSSLDERAFCSLKSDSVVDDVFRDFYGPVLPRVIATYVKSLRSRGLLIGDVLSSSRKVFDDELSWRVSVAKELLSKGLVGFDLWSSLSPKFKVEYPVKSVVLGLKGRIDRLECYPDRVVPVELKSGKVPADGVFEHHRMQVAAYGLMLEESFGAQVSEVVVHYVDANVRRSVVLNPFLRDEVKSVALSVRSMVESLSLPKGCGRDECDACRRCEDSSFVKSLVDSRVAKSLNKR